MPIVRELLHVLDASREPWTPDMGHLFATHYCIQRAYPLGHDHPSKLISIRVMCNIHEKSIRMFCDLHTLLHTFIILYNMMAYIITSIPGMPGMFSPPPRDARAVMHAGIGNPRWRGKRSRHSQRMRNPQFDVSGKRPMADVSTAIQVRITQHWEDLFVMELKSS